MATFDKALSFGLLNVSRHELSTLALRAIVAPSHWRQSQLTFTERENQIEWDALDRIGVLNRLRRSGLVPVLPDDDQVALFPGEKTRVQRRGYPDPEQSDARRLVRSLGPVPREQIDDLVKREQSRLPYARTREIKLESGGLRRYTVAVESPKKSNVYLIRVVHTAHGQRIGSYNIVFVPHGFASEDEPALQRGAS